MPEETKGGENEVTKDQVEPKVETPAVDPAMANPLPPAEAETSGVAGSSGTAESSTPAGPPSQPGNAEPTKPIEPTTASPASPAPAATPEKKSGCGCWIIGIIVVILILVIYYILSFFGYVVNPFIGVMSLFG